MLYFYCKSVFHDSKIILRKKKMHCVLSSAVSSEKFSKKFNTSILWHKINEFLRDCSILDDLINKIYSFMLPQYWPM